VFAAVILKAACDSDLEILFVDFFLINTASVIVYIKRLIMASRGLKRFAFRIIKCEMNVDGI